MEEGWNIPSFLMLKFISRKDWDYGKFWRRENEKNVMEDAGILLNNDYCTGEDYVSIDVEIKN